MFLQRLVSFLIFSSANRNQIVRNVLSINLFPNGFEAPPPSKSTFLRVAVCVSEISGPLFGMWWPVWQYAGFKSVQYGHQLFESIKFYFGFFYVPKDQQICHQFLKCITSKLTTFPSPFLFIEYILPCLPPQRFSSN